MGYAVGFLVIDMPFTLLYPSCSMLLILLVIWGNNETWNCLGVFYTEVYLHSLTFILSSAWSCILPGKKSHTISYYPVMLVCVLFLFYLSMVISGLKISAGKLPFGCSPWWWVSKKIVQLALLKQADFTVCHSHVKSLHDWLLVSFS